MRRVYLHQIIKETQDVDWTGGAALSRILAIFFLGALFNNSVLLMPKFNCSLPPDLWGDRSPQGLQLPFQCDPWRNPMVTSLVSIAYSLYLLLAEKWK
jgi:hypothetical protein